MALFLASTLTTTASAFTPGKDGNLTVAAANTVVNIYTTMSQNASAGDNRVRQTATSNTLNLTVGDLILIYQAQGASIDTPNSYLFGNITNLNGAGRYEFARVTSVPIFNGNQNGQRYIGISTTCGGLENSYTVSQGSVQIIKVPQYADLTIQSGASIVPADWNGTTGGVVAVHVNGTLNIASTGSISATGNGFRGAARETSGAPTGITDYSTTVNDNGAAKGEGIAGQRNERGRGAAANGGGGGSSHNAAGGGGANGNNGNSWTIGNPAVTGGQGVMQSAYAAGWALDPSYALNGNALTNSSGGGRGGYTWGQTNSNPLTNDPGSGWSGDNRREVGGLGGRPLDNSPTGRLFLGGGGGAGHSNNDNGGAGGDGGGLVFVLANQVTGTGSIVSNGVGGGNAGATNASNDAAGGAGAGGTIILRANNIANTITVSAVGGKGGDQFWNDPNGTDETEGPGGGGGGGYIAFTGAGNPTRTVAGGASGINNKTFMLPFTVNGATDGATGRNVDNVNTLILCSGSITGKVFNDYNGNGTLDGGEPGIAGVSVTITPSAGAAFTLTTDSSGNYNALVPTGSTTAVVNGSSPAIPAGAILTSGATPTPGGTLSQTRTVTDNAAIATNNVGYQSPAILQITEEPSVTATSTGSTYTYLITFTNTLATGTGAYAQNVVITNNLPNLTPGFQSATRQVNYVSGVVGGGFTGTVTNNNGVVTAAINGNVLPGQTGTLTLTVTVQTVPFLVDNALYNIARLNGTSQQGGAITQVSNDSTITIDAPLLVQLLSFTATPDPKSGLINVQWVTAAEYGTAGFDVYRVSEDKSSYTKINAELIDPLGSPVEGATYGVSDPVPMKYNQRRGYLLVETELSGNVLSYGPIWYPDFEVLENSAIENWKMYE